MLEFKMILVGNPGVGKSSILMRLFSDKFQKDYFPTIGVDFYKQFVTKFNFKAICFDFGGVNLDYFLKSPFLEKTDIALFVCVNFNNETAHYLKKLALTIRNSNKTTPVHIIIVRNKIDIFPVKIDEKLKIKNFCQTEQCSSCKISVKNIEDFKSLPIYLMSLFTKHEKIANVGIQSDLEPINLPDF